MSAIDQGEVRRALSHGCELVTWPPAVGDRIHYNSGWAHTSWSAEVRAIVDDEVAVIAKWTPRSGRRRYDLLDRIAVGCWSTKTRGDGPGCLWRGPLPKEVTKGHLDE